MEVVIKAEHSKQPMGSLRIIGGQWRGRKLPVLTVDDLRPTGDRVRETLFNWLQFEWEGSAWLDVFSGSGSLSFEALSRGAAQVVMLEKHPAVARQLMANQQLLQAQAAQVVQTDALRWLETAPVTPFDGVFLDPPFRMESWSSVLSIIHDRGWLKPRGWVYIEQPRDRVLCLPQLSVYRHQQAGAVQFGLWQFTVDTHF
jgi:16S rRNA (guanine966-N2)-methyltransferase